MIKLGEDFLETNIFYDKSDRSGKIKIIIADKKQVEVNGVKIKKLSELIGNLNLVIFTAISLSINFNKNAVKSPILSSFSLHAGNVYAIKYYLTSVE